MNPHRPAITAAICTRNRPELLQNAIDSVLRNTGVPFELLVIDQSDDDATSMVADGRPNVRYVKAPPEGAAAARNLALKLASADVVAFTDDDCVVPPDWLATATQIMAENLDVSTCFGCVVAPRDQGTGGAAPAYAFKRVRRVGGKYGFELGGMTANALFRRQALLDIGGFDTCMGPGSPLKSAEDFDLQFRAHRAGLVTLWTPALSVIHYGVRTHAQWKDLYMRDGIGVGAFLIKHVRCRDPLAVKLWFKFVGLEAARSVRTWIRFRGRGARPWFLAGLLRGTLLGLRHDMDHTTRMYKPS